MATTGDEEQLLVFGYACKLFRDNERATQVDKGEYLVPWMGNSSIMLDRFDARGVLSNLKNYEAIEGEMNQEDYMTPEEVMTEEMCDDERYRSMKIADEAETDFAIEEINKRVLNPGAEVGFNYDKPKAETSTSEISLHQMATVIEKTSEFMATQGAQMEILMRAKEAHNPKFQFLNPGNPYHSIYKQVLEKKKARASGSGKLLANLPEVPSIEEVEQSLRNLARNLPSAAPGSNTTNAAGSTNAYSKLVEKMRVNLPPPPPPVTSAGTSSSSSSTPPPSSARVDSKPTLEAKANEDEVLVQVPPYEEQALIDQTASYVCRNGGEKLGILRKRMPEKFAFLRSDNKFNTYYQFKVTLYHEMRAERNKEQKARAVANANAAAAAALQDPAKHFPLLKGFFR